MGPGTRLALLIGGTLVFCAVMRTAILEMGERSRNAMLAKMKDPKSQPARPAVWSVNDMDYVLVEPPDVYLPSRATCKIISRDATSISPSHLAWKEHGRAFKEFTVYAYFPGMDTDLAAAKVTTFKGRGW